MIFVSPLPIGNASLHVCNGGCPNEHTCCILDSLKNWRNLAFSISCRQVYNESTSIFGGENHFRVRSSRAGLCFFRAIPPPQRAILRTMSFSYIQPALVSFRLHRGVKDACRYFKACNRLTNLEVSAYSHHVDNAGCRNTNIFNIDNAVPLLQGLESPLSLAIGLSDPDNFPNIIVRNEEMLFVATMLAASYSGLTQQDCE